MTWVPRIGLDGFRVSSAFDVNELSCEDLRSDLYQLAIILYPTDLFNEKFLIKLRDCVVKLGDTHPVKLWLRWVSANPTLSKKNQERESFLSEILNSQFNLITDLKTKTQIIEVIGQVPEDTLFEKLLKSQLYLIIGNVTKSDNLLKEIINRTPISNWKGYAPRPSFYHRMGKDHLKQIMERLGRHPADRKVFELFCLYLKNYTNDPFLLEQINAMDMTSLKQRMGLEFIEHLAPSFVQSLRLARHEKNKQILKLRDLKKFPLPMQVYWVWAFANIEPLVSQDMLLELESVHEKDLLWFYYLVDDEKISDLYTKKTGKSFVSGRRQYLKEQLEVEENFMLALFKLIELGDINSDLVRKTVYFLRHE